MYAKYINKKGQELHVEVTSGYNRVYGDNVKDVSFTKELLSSKMALRNVPIEAVYDTKNALILKEGFVYRDTKSSIFFNEYLPETLSNRGYTLTSK